MNIAVAPIAGLAWLAYFGLSIAGLSLRRLPLSLAANGVYFAVAVAVFALFAPTDAVVAAPLLVLAATGCVIESLAIIRRDRGMRRVAFAVFGLFLALLGALLLRAAVDPVFLGYALIVAGLGALTLLIPRVPRELALVPTAAAALAEGAFVLWLLARAFSA